MSTAMKSRFVNINFEVDLEDWLLWAFANNIHPAITGFIRFRPGLLHCFDPSRHNDTFPCPRTWQFASDILWLDISDGQIEFELLGGCVGNATAVELAGHIKIHRELPDIDLLLMHPEQYQPTRDPSINWALCAALIYKANLKNLDSIFKIADKMSPEFSVYLISDIAKTKPETIKTKSFAVWAAKNQSVIL
jgi:hypothetical protein